MGTEELSGVGVDGGSNEPEVNSTEPEVKHYGRHQKRNIFTKVLNTAKDVLSATPAAVLTKYWSGGHRNIGSDEKEANAHQDKLSPAELKAAQGEAYEAFKNVTFVYAYHGNNNSLVDEKAKYKLSDDEQKYIGIEKSSDGKVKKFLNGSEVVGYLDDEKTGARAVALKGKDGKVTISIAGGDMSTGARRDLVKDSDDIFGITSGNMSGQFKQVYDFAKDIQKHEGHVDNIVGHSLGAHIATALVPAFQDSKFYIYDGPGVTKNLEHQMSKFYGLTEKETVKIFDEKKKDILEVENGKNSFNTLGWLPREVTMVDPAKDNYKPTAGNIVPHGHFYGHGFYEAIRNLDPAKDNGEPKLFNQTHDEKDKSPAPKYITGAEAGMGAGVFAIPVVGQALTGAGAVYGWIAHKVKDNPNSLGAMEQLDNRINDAQRDNNNTNGAEHQGKKITQEELDGILAAAKKSGVKLSIHNVEGKDDIIEVERHGVKKSYHVEFADDHIGNDKEQHGR